ncbi:MAG: hypothetical protein WCY37_00620 [Candidatus Dojkabacteria bacterium]|jgi:hypothetical protein
MAKISSSNRNLIGRLFIFLVFVLLLAAIVVGAIIVLRNTKPEVQVVEYEKDVPVWTDRVQQPDADDRIVLGDEVLCQFAEGWTAEGLTVPSGTKVTGPAVVKQNRDLDWGIPIYVGETYTTVESDEVVWLLNGDNACVDAQSPYFSYWQEEAPKN